MTALHDGALYVWAMLEQARNNQHPYGEHSAELYAQHLLADGPPTKESWLKAGKLLYAIIDQFCHIHSVKAFVNGRAIGEWMDEFEFFHKCEVRIENVQGNKKKPQGANTEVI